MTRLFLPLALLITLVNVNTASAAAHKEGELDKEVASILKLYEHARGNINKYVKGLNDEQVNFVAKIGDNQFNNSIAMLAHHIINTEMYFLSILSGEKADMKTVEDPFKETDAKAKDIEAAMMKSYELFKNTIKHLKSADLKEDGFKMGDNQMNKGETVNFNVWHLTHHGGHMVVLRRLQGITKE